MDCAYRQKTAKPIRVLVVDDLAFLRGQRVKPMAMANRRPQAGVRQWLRRLYRAPTW